MPRYLRMKFENWKLLWWKIFWRLESKLVRSQRKEKKDHGRKKVCSEVVDAGVRFGVGLRLHHGYCEFRPSTVRNEKIIFDSKHHLNDPITFLRIWQTDFLNRI